MPTDQREVSNLFTEGLHVIPQLFSAMEGKPPDQVSHPVGFIRQECSRRHSWSHSLVLQLVWLAIQLTDVHIHTARAAYKRRLLMLLVSGEGKWMRFEFSLHTSRMRSIHSVERHFHHQTEVIRLGLSNHLQDLCTGKNPWWVQEYPFSDQQQSRCRKDDQCPS